MLEQDILWKLPPQNKEELHNHSQQHPSCDETDCHLRKKTPYSLAQREDWKTERATVVQWTLNTHNKYDVTTIYSDL